MALYIYMQLTHNLIADFHQVISDAAGSLKSLSRVVKAFHKSLCHKNNVLSFPEVERWIECVRVRIDTLIYLKKLICSAARMRSTPPYGCVAMRPWHFTNFFSQKKYLIQVIESGFWNLFKTTFSQSWKWQ